MGGVERSGGRRKMIMECLCESRGCESMRGCLIWLEVMQVVSTKIVMGGGSW